MCDKRDEFRQTWVFEVREPFHEVLHESTSHNRLVGGRSLVKHKTFLVVSQHLVFFLSQLHLTLIKLLQGSIELVARKRRGKEKKISPQ